MAQASWSIKVDQETKDRIDAALEKIVEDGAAATKGEALASLVPAIESEVASAGSPTVAANLAAIKQAQSVISANAAAIAQTLANAEEAARAGAVEELYGRFAGLIDRLGKAE